MASLRLWILLLAAAAFGAGVGVGWLASQRIQASERLHTGPFESFQREFARTFKISAERQRALADLLANYQSEIREREEAQLELGRGELETQLEKLALKYREHIRNSVLPPEQRSEYDRLAAGLDWKTSN